MIRSRGIQTAAMAMAMALTLAPLSARFSWAGSQTRAEDEAVLGVVQKFFDTMTAKDTAGARETLILEGQFMSLREGDDPPSVRATPLTTYVEQLSAGPRRQEERMWDPVVQVYGRIAMVWTPYDFYTDGELSHCGIDVFTLLDTKDGWRIAGVTYTVEPKGCDALEQPPR